MPPRKAKRPVKPAGRTARKPAPRKAGARPAPEPKSKSKSKQPVPRKALPAATPAEAAADVPLVGRTLALLHEQDRAAATGRRAIGAHLLDEYFGGSAELARSRSPVKATSYALLAQRAAEETSWDARDFREAVTIELCARSLPVALVEKLDPTYLLRLFAIDDPSARASVAARIAGGEAQGQEAKDLIAKHAGVERRGGRELRPAAERAASALERALARAEEDAAFTEPLLDAIVGEGRVALGRRFAALAEALQRLATRLQQAP